MTVRRKKEEQAGGAHEAYETPAWCVRRLLEALALPAGRWLEPCAASGQIIRATSLVDGYQGVAWDAAEIRPECRDQLESLCPGRVAIGDFLAGATRFREGADPARRWAYDVILTNPPFSLAQPFIETSRALAPIVVMLLPVQFFGSAGREQLFEQHTPSAIYQLPDRPQFTGGGSNSVEYGWWVWEAARRRQRGTWLERLAITSPEERGVRSRGRAPQGAVLVTRTEIGAALGRRPDTGSDPAMTLHAPSFGGVVIGINPRTRPDLPELDASGEGAPLCDHCGHICVDGQSGEFVCINESCSRGPS